MVGLERKRLDKTGPENQGKYAVREEVKDSNRWNSSEIEKEKADGIEQESKRGMWDKVGK